ncbi:unnamed protein product [Cochlearia groenlandica]
MHKDMRECRATMQGIQRQLEKLNRWFGQGDSRENQGESIQDNIIAPETKSKDQEGETHTWSEYWGDKGRRERKTETKKLTRFPDVDAEENANANRKTHNGWKICYQRGKECVDSRKEKTSREELIFEISQPDQKRESCKEESRCTNVIWNANANRNVIADAILFGAHIHVFDFVHRERKKTTESKMDFYGATQPEVLISFWEFRRANKGLDDLETSLVSEQDVETQDKLVLHSEEIEGSEKSSCVNSIQTAHKLFDQMPAEVEDHL